MFSTEPPGTTTVAVPLVITALPGGKLEFPELITVLTSDLFNSGVVDWVAKEALACKTGGAEAASVFCCFCIISAEVTDPIK